MLSRHPGPYATCTTPPAPITGRVSICNLPLSPPPRPPPPQQALSTCKVRAHVVKGLNVLHAVIDLPLLTADLRGLPGGGR